MKGLKWPGGRIERRHYVLFVLTLAYCSNAVDRATLGILQEPIKHEFGLSDTQLGTLSGIAFALPYALAALPFGIAADRFNRRNLLAACLVAWSAFTAFAGLSRNFIELLISRIGVGGTEPGAGPAAMSMITDLYTAKQRATALAVFYLSAPAGLLIAFMVCAPVAQHYGWHAGFFAAGLPGIVLAVVLMLTVGEPKRGGAEPRTQPHSAPAPVGPALKFMLKQPSLIHLMIGTSVVVFLISGVSTWLASFFIRIHGLPLGVIGPKIGIMLASASVLGTLCGGVMADRLARRDERWRFWVLAGIAFFYLPFCLGIALADTPNLALVFCAAYGFLSTSWAGPSYALAHSLVGVRMRGTVTAVMLVTSNLVGYGLGPMAVGVLSDRLAAHFGDQSLRYALMIIPTLGLWATLHLLLAARHLRRDMARAAALTENDMHGPKQASSALAQPLASGAALARDGRSPAGGLVSTKGDPGAPPRD